MLTGPIPTLQRGRRLRKAMSLPEVLLWQRLRKRPGGFKFRRQHPAGRYVADFFCVEAKVAIEVDGSSHDHPDRAAKDAQRSAFFAAYDVQVVRFPAAEVFRDAAAVVDAIVAACRARGHPSVSALRALPPPRSGEDFGMER